MLSGNKYMSRSSLGSAIYQCLQCLQYLENWVEKNVDITELLRDRRTDERTDEWKSGHLCRKVRRSGRYFIQGLMVV